MAGFVGISLFANSIPKVTGDQPGTQLIGETFSQQLCFENNGTATGYEPQLELVTPAGIKLTAATFYGSSTISHQETCMATDCNVTNPFIGQQNLLFSPIDGNESYYVLDFPIGSFSTQWPRQCMDLTFQLENSGDHVQPGNPLDIKTVAVFSLGETAVDDGNYTYGPEHNLTVIPNVYTIKKQNDATEAERATGPKYPIRATITVDIAKDENLTNLQLVDDLDGGMQFKSLLSDANCTHSSLPSTTSPGGTLDLDCGAIKGVLGPDLTIIYEYYIPEFDNNGSAILGGDCQWRPLVNRAHATGVHDFNGTYPVLPRIDANSTVTAKAITIHKTSRISQDAPPAGFGPGDQVEYILTMDVSGYADQSHIVISDTIGDGQEFNSTAPTDYNLSTGIAGTFSSNNINVTYDSTTGTSLIKFDLSQQLQDDHNISVVDANTTITVKFITTIDEKYKVINNAGHIAMGDVVANHVDLDTAMGDGVTPCQTEKSDTSNTVATEQMAKTIYAVNGDTNISALYLIHPGDTVTYRLKSVMPVESFFDFKLLDYLPIPFFKATEVTTQGANSSTTAGTWALGPDNNYSKPPIFSSDNTQNSLTWDFQDDNTTQRGTVLDILFTVTATNEPMADSLTLANIGGTKYKNAAQVDFGTADLIDVVTQQPFVKLEKTIIATSNNQGQTLPAQSLDKVDANDMVTYRIHLENTGHGIAYDVNLTDRFEQDGTPGQGLHSCTVISTDTNGTTGTNTTGDLFAGTYTIDSIDALSYFDVTYECTVNQDANPGNDINNTAILKAYASTPGGPNFVHLIIKSETKLTLTSKMEIVKNIVGSSIPDTNPDNNLNQGEIVNFEINVTLGEGTYTNYALTDNTCTGLALQSQSSNVVINGTTVTVLGTGGSVDGNLSYTCQKQMIVGGTNTATVTADLIGQKIASTNWTVTNPHVVTSKTMSPSQADAGDLVTVTMNWTNDTSHPAYKCSVTDPLDTSIFDINTIAITTTPTGYTCSVVGNKVQCIYTGDLTLPCPNGPAEFKVNVRNDVNTSSNLINELSFKGVTLPDGHTGESNTTINGNVESNATATLELRSPVPPVKIFTATSEAFTDLGDAHLNNTPDVAIGEIIDVNITYGFYEGTTLEVYLDDQLLDGGRLVYVPGTMKISRDSANLFVGESDINTSLTAAAVGTAVSVDDFKLAASNTLISLPLGDVLNNSSTSTTSVANLTLSFKVKVQNESSVQAGVLIRDRGRVRFNDSATGTQRTNVGNIRSGRTVEPRPAVTKDVNQTVVQAGTQLTYTIKVCNDESNSSNFVSSGFDWNISDRIPDDILLSSGPTVDLNGTSATVNVSMNGQDINATIDRLDRGECISIAYEAIVQQSAQYGQVMTNTANFQTTSLPGFYGTAGSLPGLSTQEPGEVNGERTGTGVGVNDLFGHNDATVTMETGAIEKVLLSPKQWYAIGEQARYQIVVGLPKGESNNFKVIDTLPAGLHYESATATVSTGANLTYTGTPLPAQVSGNTITFDFGDINTTSVSTIRIEYNVTVENTSSNQNGVTLQNNAKATYNDPNQAGTTITLTPQSLPTVNVGEPNIEIQKRITAGAVKAQAGSLVSWEVVISNDPANNAHTTAYAVDWNDTLPPHLANITNATLQLNGTPAVISGTTTPLASTDLVVNNTTLSLPLFDLPVGATVTITFDTNVTNDAVSGETQTNKTSAHYLSLLGADGSLLGGRNSTDCGDDDDNSTLNNYCESATADLVIDAGIAIDKHLQSTVDHFTIGQKVTYKMRISLIEGITKNVVLTDTLPAGLRYVSHTHHNGAPSMTYDFASANTNSGTDTNVIINFGDVNNTADGNSSNDFIDVDLTVLVENVPGNQNGDTPSNGNAAQGSSVTVASDANTSAVTVPVPITITEPDLNVVKTVTPTISGTPSQALGDIITYHIHVSHTAASTSDAYDVNFTDTLDPGLIYIPGSAVGATVTQSGQTLTFGFAHLAQGYTRDISYKAQIDPNAAVGVDLNNSLYTVFGGLPDANGSVDGGRNGTDGVGGALNNYALHTAVPVTPNADTLKPVKDQTFKVDTNNDGLVNAGDLLEYNLSTENNNSYEIGELNVTDTLDPNLTLLLDSIKVYHNSVEIFNADTSTTALDWNTTTQYWYHYANSDFEINYYGDTNYFELYWHNTILNSGDTFDILFDTKINDGNVTSVTFNDGSVLDINRSNYDYVNTGTVIDNTFTVDSNRTVPTTSNEVNVTTQIADFNVTKMQVSAKSPVTQQGDLIQYQIIVENNGTVALHDINITEVYPGAGDHNISAPTASDGNTTALNTGAKWVYDVNYTVTQADIDANTTLINKVIVDTNETNTPTYTPKEANATTPVAGIYDLNVSKRQTGGSNPVTSAGEVILYTIVVENNGTATLTDINLTEIYPGSGIGHLSAPTASDGNTTVLNVGKRWIYDANYTVTQADIDTNTTLVNKVSVFANGTPTREANVTTPVAGTYDLNVTKQQTGGPNPVTQAGDVIVYDIVVTNTGSASLTGVVPIETYPGVGDGNVTGPDSNDGNTTTLHPGASWTYKAHYAVTQADIDANATLVNKVRIVTNEAVSNEANATTPVAGRPGFVIDKTQTGGSNPVSGAGNILTYTITVRNTGTISLTGVNVVETYPSAGAGTLSAPSESISSNGILDVGEVWTYTATYSVTQADVDKGGYLVNRIAVNTNETGTLVEHAQASTRVGVMKLALAKRVNTSVSPGPYAPGNAVVFTITVINQGTLDAKNVQVTDYIPAGLTLHDPGWRSSGNKATLRTPIAIIPTGSSKSIDIAFKIDESLHSTKILNIASIVSNGATIYAQAPIEVTCPCNICVPCGCRPTLTLNVSDITHQSAELKWNYTGNCDGFEIYRNGYFVTYVNANTDSYTLMQLIPDTEYTVKVDTVLGDGGDVSDSVVFTTKQGFNWLPAVYHILMN